jgi:sugar phosphate isomerase/epimerase
MKVGLSGLLFYRIPVEDAVSRVAELGADCVEIIFDVPHFSPAFRMEELRGLKKMVGSYDVEVSVHGPIWDFNPASWHQEVRSLSLKKMKQSIDVCSALGGDVVVMHPGRCPIPQIGKLLTMTRTWFGDFTLECLKYAKMREVKLTLENFPTNREHPYSSPKDMVALTRKLDGLEITFDVGHAFLHKCKENIGAPEKKIAEEIKLIGKHLVHVHIHDNHGSWDEHLIPGDGGINFAPIVKALKEVNYKGRIIAELHNPYTKMPMEVGRAGLKKVRDIFKVN